MSDEPKKRVVIIKRRVKGKDFNKPLHQDPVITEPKLKTKDMNSVKVSREGEMNLHTYLFSNKNLQLLEDSIIGVKGYSLVNPHLVDLLSNPKSIPSYRFPLTVNSFIKECKNIVFKIQERETGLGQFELYLNNGKTIYFGIDTDGSNFISIIRGTTLPFSAKVLSESFENSFNYITSEDLSIAEDLITPNANPEDLIDSFNKRTMDFPYIKVKKFLKDYILVLNNDNRTLNKSKELNSVVESGNKIASLYNSQEFLSMTPEQQKKLLKIELNKIFKFNNIPPASSSQLSTAVDNFGKVKEHVQNQERELQQSKQR